MKSVFSQRELAVVELVAQGLSNREIGDRLHIAESTVKTHLTKACTKAGVNGRVALAHYYASEGSGLVSAEVAQAVAVRSHALRGMGPDWSPKEVYRVLKACIPDSRDVTGLPEAVVEKIGSSGRDAFMLVCAGLETMGLIRREAGHLLIARERTFEEACDARLGALDPDELADFRIRMRSCAGASTALRDGFAVFCRH